jgi:4-amino-4-deoxy-L-arabinose transferase-like glycosyltransferase
MTPAASFSPRQPACLQAENLLCSKLWISPGALRIWLGLAIFLYFLQVLPYLSYRWVTDESWYAGTAYSIAHGNGIANPAIGPNDLEHKFDAHPPGTALIIAACFRVFGTSQIAARLGSVAAGLIIILVVYRLARDVIGLQGAMVAAFLVATDNLMVLASRSARPEALTTMAIVLSLFAIQKYACTNRIGWAFLSGLLAAAGTMFHITLLGYIISFGLLAVVIDYSAHRVLLRGASFYSLGYILGLVPFSVWILTAQMGRAGFREEFLNRAGGGSLWSRFLLESYRYSDFLGFNMLHMHGLDNLPVRIFIPLILLAASYYICRLRRRWFYLELLLLIPTMLWFAYTVNKSSRYLALLAPVFALIMGAAVHATTANRRLHRIMLLSTCLVIAAQLSANLFLLHAARYADYNKVSAELKSVIPPGQTAYGAISFWLALHDHPYISYERTDPWMAASQFHARYFITGDRAMTGGVAGDDAFYANLRQRMDLVISRSQLAADFYDPYYGYLRVYKLRAF